MGTHARHPDGKYTTHDGCVVKNTLDHGVYTATITNTPETNADEETPKTEDEAKNPKSVTVTGRVVTADIDQSGQNTDSIGYARCTFNCKEDQSGVDNIKKETRRWCVRQNILSIEWQFKPDGDVVVKTIVDPHTKTTTSRCGEDLKAMVTKQIGRAHV